MVEAFLDTSVILDKVLGLSREASRLFNDTDMVLHTNEYVLKEVYHVLKKRFEYSEMEIGYVLDFIRESCIIHPAPSKEELRKIRITDKADRPIIVTARKFGLVLYVDDERTFRGASKYVSVTRINKDQ
jgi:predicted nucleic acid-binding protein